MFAPDVSTHRQTSRPDLIRRFSGSTSRLCHNRMPQAVQNVLPTTTLWLHRGQCCATGVTGKADTGEPQAEQNVFPALTFVPHRAQDAAPGPASDLSGSAGVDNGASLCKASTTCA